MAELQQNGDELQENFAECRRLREEAEGRLRGAEEGGERHEEAETLRAEVARLRTDEETFERMIQEHRRQEKKLPWNVDTMSREGFSKVSWRHRADLATVATPPGFLTPSSLPPTRACSTLGRMPLRTPTRKKWRSTSPLRRSTQRRSGTLVRSGLHVCFASVHLAKLVHSAGQKSGLTM